MITFDSKLGRYVVWNEHDKELKFTFNIEADKESDEKKEIDVWKMMETISEFYDVEDLEEAFGCYCLADAIDSCTLEEFAKLFEAYEEKRKEIRVGDEVEWTDAFGKRQIGIVTSIREICYRILVVYTDGNYSWFDTTLKAKDKVTKTGRSFAELFKEES